MKRAQVAKEVRDELEDLLTGLKLIRENFDKGNPEEARRILEIVGHRLANVINNLK